MAKPTTSPGLTIEGWIHYRDSGGTRSSWPLDFTGTVSNGETTGRMVVAVSNTTITLWETDDYGLDDFSFAYFMATGNDAVVEFRESSAQLHTIELKVGHPLILGSDSFGDSLGVGTLTLSNCDRVRIHEDGTGSSTVYWMLAR